MSQSTRKSRQKKPAKPHPQFPLFPHATGRWAKKIRQKLHYFGKVADDPDGTKALDRLHRELPYLKDGRVPPPANISADAPTVRDLVNSFLTHKTEQLDTGEVSPRTFDDYHSAGRLVIDAFGPDRPLDDLRPDDFRLLRRQLAKGVGLVTLKNRVRRIRSIIKFALDAGVVKTAIETGVAFRIPSADALEREKAKNGGRMVEAEELRKIIEEADPVMKAAVLLAINAGYGNTDIANLTTDHLDLESGWSRFPRPKTGAPRKAPLWPETVEAVRKALDIRPRPKDASDSKLVFLTTHGQRWVRVQEREPGKWIQSDSLQTMFRILLRKLNLYRPGLSFYSIRHAFLTIAEESRDFPAVKMIMGHRDSSMSGHYRERISDARLRAVVETVRGWLWPEKGDA
jgi:integrase